MGGDGGQPLQMSPASAAEEQYVKAKTSVWWDIENCHVPKISDPHAIAQNISSALVKMNYCGPVSISAYGDTTRISPAVQQALNSTGVALNHVPAGVKDASDKKILVDMLFWAVDNPAPANYLLISGDRDFSNALHQLRMRRYNILLAQPQKASAALVAAAKSVWLWTSLSAGGLPLTKDESVQFVTNGNGHLSVNDSSHTDFSKANQPVDSFPESPHSGNQKFSNMGRENDAKYKGKQPRRNGTQPIAPRPPNFMPRPEEDYNNSNFRTAYGQPNQFTDPQDLSGTYNVTNSGPGPSHFTGIPDSSWTNGNYPHGSHQNHYPQPLRPNGPPIDPALLPNQNWHSSSALPHMPVPPFLASGPPNYVPDVSNLNISEPPRTDHKSFGSQQRNGGERRKTSAESPNRVNLNGAQKGYNNNAQKKSAFRQEAHTSRHPHGVWGTPGCPEPSDHVQSLIGIILLAINTLRFEKIMPTVENIKDCIRCGDVGNRNTNVKQALAFAVEHQMVEQQQVGSLQLYVMKNQKLWNCVNPMCGDVKKYPKSTWDEIENFLSSAAGRSAIMDTQCRYEAATVLKKMCLKELLLGEILQILYMVLHTKKWIIYNNNGGWKPIKVTVAEVNPTPGLASAT